MILLSQRDPRWANIKVGTGIQTIGQVGCFITVIAMILNTTPDVVNSRLIAVGGFTDDNEIDWTKIAEAFPGVVCRRVWTYDNADVLKNVPNVLVQVNGAPIGGSLHAVRFVGNHLLNDPWDGKQKLTNAYQVENYAVFIGTWNQSTGDDVLINAIKNAIDSNQTPHDKVQQIRNILK